MERPERDAAGAIVLATKGKTKGKPVPDSALRATENVPLSEDVNTYFAREVLPHASDAWIDHEKTHDDCGTDAVSRIPVGLPAEYGAWLSSIMSSTNLKYMRFFAAECPDGRIGQRTADQLPWSHIVTHITELDTPALREWYAREAVAQSWGRETLTQQIRSQLHLRRGASVNNFAQRLAADQANMAAQILKDPYHEFFIDLLFYHTRLKCHVVVELTPARSSRSTRGG